MFDDIDYNEVFGVSADPADGSGAEDRQSADAGADAAAAGAEEQDVADPAEDNDIEAAPESAGEEEEADGPSETGDSPDSKQRGKKDSVYAAARRRAEAEAGKKLDEIIKGYGWTNPYTNTPIESRADYDAYRSAFDEEKQEKVRKKTGMSKEEFNEYIDSLPQVKAAKEAQAQAQEARIQAQIADELRQISALDPAVHTVADVLNGENGGQIKQLISQGRTMLEAFKLVNFDRLRELSGEDERRHADLNAQSKSHLTQSRSRGQGMTAVPKDVKEYYNVFLPNMSDAEMQRDYNKYLRDSGG